MEKWKLLETWKIEKWRNIFWGEHGKHGKLKHGKIEHFGTIWCHNGAIMVP